jgi:alkaline phosphatase D
MMDLQRLSQAVEYEGGISRRLFLAVGAALAALPATALRAAGAQRRPVWSSDPFSLGVASGDPGPSSVVLWTRLAPQPLEPGGGMPAEAVEVGWELAEDEAFSVNRRAGVAWATPQLGHSVHVEVHGLPPDRWFFYRFHAGDAVSPVGRTRTMPPPQALPTQLRFAFASCQHYEQGLYTAYEHMAGDEVDMVFHLGDYIYEGAGRDNLVRKHAGPKLTTLDDYRIRHAQYRSDPLLHRMHAACPWVVTWDDHEFENNYANAVSERPGVDPGEFLQQRANAYQAYYEAMPLRRSSLPRGPHMKLYRTVSFGRLAGFQVLDTRQYRTDQPNGDVPHPLNDEALHPSNTMLGARQAGWLKAALLKSTAVWNVLAQQVMMGMVGFARAQGPLRYSMDQWPGYAYERMRLLEFLHERRVANPVVLTGDIHSNWVHDLRVDDRRPELPVVATEFVGTSISSGGNTRGQPSDLDAVLANNPFVKLYNRNRGYVRCTLTPQQWRSDYVVVEDVVRPGGKAHTLASFVVEAGRPGAQRA